jgi:hypothetical protein
VQVVAQLLDGQGVAFFAVQAEPLLANVVRASTALISAMGSACRTLR